MLRQIDAGVGEGLRSQHLLTSTQLPGSVQTQGPFTGLMGLSSLGQCRGNSARPLSVIRCTTNPALIAFS